MNGYTSTTLEKIIKKKKPYQFQRICFAYTFSKIDFRNKYSLSNYLASNYIKILIAKKI